MNQINQITYPESVASPSTSHTESLPRISFAIRRALGVERVYSRFEEEEVESPLSHVSVPPTIQADQDQVAVAQTPRVVASVVCVVENGACAFSDAFPPSLRGKLPDSVFEQRIASVNMLLVGVKGLDEYSPLWFGLPLLYAGFVAGFMFGGVLQTTSVWGIVLLVGCLPVLLAAYYLGTSVHNPKVDCVYFVRAVFEGMTNTFLD
ncbi:hypothetical protein BCR33DRAFT_713353 [Rhizoclosmatium globosum]|uniref:Uncharacterized protein n=1 Tax=Rhizoclosmatium globosum TaxID=329046 RepID=A0A1Y2CUE5_9FUNG|nr:hypothetical protein BCR33DRAFT_713353 [Rhizoclosmatium globosum]|eukprot:ORY50587.1 hypothetical protein BCR33DRAFT_713353 [Rhizoclosmatium globosum]